MQGKRSWAEIDLDALSENIKTLNSKVRGEIMAVVKANAYGHGAAVVAPYLEQLGIHHFAVASIEEAEELRSAGVVGEILILGYTDPDLTYELFENNINQTVFSLNYAKLLNASAKKRGIKIPVTLKLDTGMSRIGFNCKNKEEIYNSIDDIVKVFSLSNLSVTAAFSHFAVADSTNSEDIEFTKQQSELLLKTLSEIKIRTGKNLTYHINNSAGAIFNKEDDLKLNRVGISLYGLTPDSSLKLPIKLNPVMSFKAVISQIKTVKKGESISYGRTFIADNDITVATIPVGYADGILRSLSNKGYVYLNGKKANIVGRVCMDQMMIDITGIKAKEGDTVEIFGKNLHAEELADIIDTINYELVCAVSRRVPRIYYKAGKIIRIENYIIG